MLCAFLSKGISLRRGSRALSWGWQPGRGRQVLLAQLLPQLRALGGGAPTLQRFWGEGRGCPRWVWGRHFSAVTPAPLQLSPYQPEATRDRLDSLP